MNYYAIPGVPRQDQYRDWNDTPEDIRISYLHEQDELLRQNLSIAEIKSKEAEIYNRHFAQYGFRKPVMS